MAANIMVQALAGTGKTFCVTEGVHRMVGNKRKTVGSEEQQAVWNAMMQDEHPGRIHMTSFTTDASEQLANKGPLDARGDPLSTCNSTYGMGVSFAKAAGQAGYIDIYGNKYKGLTTEFMGGTKFETNKTDPGMWEAIFEIQQKARLQLFLEMTPKQVEDIADWYAVSIPAGKKDGKLRLDIVTEGVNAVLQAGRENVGRYDFTDMVYLPVVQGLIRKRYETLIVDEAQDLGKAQQEVCLQSSYRRIVIGDRNQAIFGFAGADKDAFGRLQSWLELTRAGCELYPLTVTRRCSHAVVEQANIWLPGGNLKPLPNAPEGKYVKASYGQFKDVWLPKIIGGYSKTKIGPQDLMIISPTNAPLIKMMFEMQRQGIKAFINGGEITTSMQKFVERYKDIYELRKQIEIKLEMLRFKKKSKTTENQIDIYEALQGIALECTNTDDVTKSIMNMFSDKRRPGWIELSSIHKAKGREADTVVVYNWKRCDSPYSTQPWNFEQDRNLKYVANTRAKTTLIHV